MILIKHCIITEQGINWLEKKYYQIMTMFVELLKCIYNYYLVNFFLIVLNMSKIKFQCVYDDPIFLHR